jgi:hypothetical protein
MVLVDTSVWVTHFRRGEDALKALLEKRRVACHPYIIGELACGDLSNRTEILELLQVLPRATVAEHEEKLTTPKLASGKTPPDHGASAIHSADVLWAELVFFDAEKDSPVLASFMVIVKEPDAYFTSAEIRSPGLIVSELIVNEGCG